MTDIEIRHFHLFCGLGGGARGFNRGQARVGNLRAQFRCIGGVDVDPAAIRDFNKMTGTRGTALDMFDREQYRAFHGCEPPADWREATPDDIRKAAGNERPQIVFLSAPCKGFSGLLSETRSKGDKYQALNRLTVRGIWLMLEAWSDDPPELIIFENVPRIATRGRALLDRINELLHAYGYCVAETTHDCGEIGGLAQSRKRFLMVARHAEKVPAFLYEPPKRPLRAVGEILSKMPMPGDPAGGPMHAIPRRQWKTWVRLAFVEAGSDWRSLNKLNVKDGFLSDYLIIPETVWEGAGRLGVTKWDESAGTIAGASRPENGKFSVADPRFEGHDFAQFGVRKWEEPTGVVTSQRSPGQGSFSVADPRLKASDSSFQNIYRIVAFDATAKAITGASHVAGGAACVADPRPPDRPLFRKYHVTDWDSSTGTVIGGHHSEEGAYSVADPRMPQGEYGNKKYKVADWDKPTRTVISGSTTGDGAFAVADPRIKRERSEYATASEYGVLPWESPSGAVQAQGQYDNGKWSVADPRIELQRPDSYGVLRWDGPAGAVNGSGNYDNGRCSIADPRLPAAAQKLVAVIRALDGTWHRPFTTLELAALQSLVDPDEMFDLDGASDSSKRERIGNAVPPGAAECIANVMGETLLLAMSGERFMLSAQPIWVQPIIVALSVKQG